MVQLETEVKEIIRGVLFVSNQGKKEVVAGAKIIDDLGADSLEIFEVALQLEEKYGIEIPDEQIKELVTVSDAIDCIKKKISQR